MLLAPLQQFALEVHFLIRQFINVDKPPHYFLLNESLAVTVASVEVNGSHKRFESIACKVAVVGLVLFVSANELVKAYLLSKPAKRFSLHYLASGIGQKAFSLTGEVMEDNFTHDGIEYRIAQKL